MMRLTWVAVCAVGLLCAACGSEENLPLYRYNSRARRAGGRAMPARECARAQRLGQTLPLLYSRALWDAPTSGVCPRRLLIEGGLQ